MKKTLLLICMISFFGLSTFGWNGRGHMTVAAIAWDQLTEDGRKSVTELLMQHPAYTTTWESEFKNDVPLGQYLMMRAATWPDDIRSSSNPQHNMSNPAWHYITYEIHFGGHDVTNPNTPAEGDVLSAIENALKVLNDKNETKPNQAISLSWLIHLVGDVHQPLHCASMFNTDFPNGDLGGNKDYVKSKSGALSLHSLWDGALGSSTGIKSVVKLALSIEGQHLMENLENVSDSSAKAWSLVSFFLAKEKAHLNGNLKYGLSYENAVPLPKNYETNMKNLCQKQVAFAGYRLSITIESVL